MTRSPVNAKPVMTEDTDFDDSLRGHVVCQSFLDAAVTRAHAHQARFIPAYPLANWELDSDERLHDGHWVLGAR